MRFGVCVAVLLLAASASHGQKLIAQGQTWRYTKGLSYPGAGWIATNYDDSAWLSGCSGFGYGDSDDCTLLSDMRYNYVTVFTRREFIVTNAASVRALVLRANYDDGFVAWINGIEVARRGVTGPVTNTTLATSHDAIGFEEIAITNNLASLLAPGQHSTNLLAVSGHNTSSSSTDFSLIIELSALTNWVNLVRGPWLQAVTPTSVCVLVESELTDPVQVDYGPTSAYGSFAQTAYTAPTTRVPSYVHMVEINGLTPNSTYHYRASQGATNSPDATFRTLVERGTDFRFAWMADFRTGTAIHDAVASRVQAANPLFSLYGGDLCTDAEYSSFAAEFFRPNQMALASRVPFFNTVGNHETWGQNTRAFTEAPPSSSGTEDFYSFDCGDMHVLVLNYMLPYTDGTAQYRFATNDLARSTQPWKIVINHEPAYAFGGHTPSAGIRNLATNAFEKLGVDVVLNGHSHFYEHILTNAVHHLIVGSVGAPLTAVGGPHPSLLVATSSYCYAVADVSYTNFNLTVYNEAGAVLDTLRLSKSPQPAQLAFLSTPASPHAGAIVSPPVQVAVRDLRADQVAGASNLITLAVSSGELRGTLTVAAADGVATFPDLSFAQMGSGYTLTATAAGLTPVTSSAFNVLFADLNQNEIADAWEIEHFGSTNDVAGHPAADPDGDGQRNLDEFINGTVPTNSTDAFALQISGQHSNVVVLFQARFAAADHYTGLTRRYALLVSTNLSGRVWTEVAGFENIVGLNQTVSYTNPVVDAAAFYRARVRLQPW